ncbi:MAG: sulfatase-like hydrolase/transferase [Pirellulaceae bacterium]|nr:sulfatase-like hydrolase/transferase [Pirellulaceae bacterium]
MVRCLIRCLMCWTAIGWWSGLGYGQDIAKGRPNILLIFADDHSARTLSCYQHAYSLASTPNIDRLAAAGVRFAAGYMGSWCMPSRASLLTGLHPHAIQSMRMQGTYPGSTYDPRLCRFWPATFRQHGYRTAQIGKWHTGVDAGWGRDWDDQYVWNRPDNPDNASSYYGDQVIDINGKRQSVTGYPTDNYTRWACDYIRAAAQQPDRPWYLWLCYGAIHGPTTPAQRHQGRLSGQPSPLPSDIIGPRPGKPSYLTDRQAWTISDDGQVVMSGSGKSHAQWMRQVSECMLSVDEGVGQLIQTLKQSGQWENTLVVYTSDQGFANGEHGLRQKVAPYEATYASPLIVSFPGKIPAGRYCPHSINSPDLVVTLFAWAGIDLPWKMHGRDVSRLMCDPDDSTWDHPTLYEHTGDDFGSDVTHAVMSESIAKHAGVPYYVAIRQGPWKYVVYLQHSEPDELYDLLNDPHEQNNLASVLEYQERRAVMLQMLQTEVARSDAPFAKLLAAE